MQPIIIGIDPGTTTAYAVLDLKGQVLKVASSKELDFAKTVSELRQCGKPVVVGCDKAKAPWFVDKVSRAFGARLVMPRQDLKKEEKKRLLERTPPELNVHEQDALASGLFAFEKYQSLFSRIDRFLQEKGKPEYRDELKVFLVRNEEINMNAGLEFLENREARKEQKVKKRLWRGMTSPPTRKVERLESIAELLRERLEDLQSENTALREQVAALSRRLAKKGTGRDEVLKEKEARIHALSAQMERSQRELEQKGEEQKRLVAFLAGIRDDMVLVKKLENLSREELDRKRFLNISKGDVVLVQDPNIRNDQVVRELREKVSVMLCKGFPAHKEDFICVDSRKLQLNEIEDFALCSRKELEQQVSKKGILSRVLSDYRRERETL